MVQAFGAADLVVCRSGASTLGELPAAGLPALLVPLPIPGIHQGANADYLARHGAAIRVRDEEMLGGGWPAEGPLFRHIRRLLERNEERTQMVERSQALAQPDAAGRLATVLLDLATRRGPA
jgi:UDP-N-acetylglucosamine--N-acetylmuramyl-(pentapeptide) pyrophosphoryl-undecaprenol N-acetylglucosamine transferase